MTLSQHPDERLVSSDPVVKFETREWLTNALATTRLDPAEVDIADYVADLRSTVEALRAQLIEAQADTTELRTLGGTYTLLGIGLSVLARDIRTALTDEAQMFRPGHQHHNGPRRLQVNISVARADSLLRWFDRLLDAGAARLASSSESGT